MAADEKKATSWPTGDFGYASKVTNGFMTDRVPSPNSSLPAYSNSGAYT